MAARLAWILPLTFRGAQGQDGEAGWTPESFWGRRKRAPPMLRDAHLHDDEKKFLPNLIVTGARPRPYFFVNRRRHHL